MKKEPVAEGEIRGEIIIQEEKSPFSEWEKLPFSQEENYFNGDIQIRKVSPSPFIKSKNKLFLFLMCCICRVIFISKNKLAVMQTR